MRNEQFFILDHKINHIELNRKHYSSMFQITKGITSYSVAVNNSVISCNFTRAYSLDTPDAQFFDIKRNKYVLMFVHGKTELKKGMLHVCKGGGGCTYFLGFIHNLTPLALLHYL